MKRVLHGLLLFGIVAILLMPVCGSDRYGRVRNDERAKSMECDMPCVNFRLPRSQDGLIRVLFLPDSVVHGVRYNAFRLSITGMVMTAPQSGRLQRYLLRDGFPTTTDMPVVQWLQSERVLVRHGAHREYQLERKCVDGIWYGFYAGQWRADSTIAP